MIKNIYKLFGREFSKKNLFLIKSLTYYEHTSQLKDPVILDYVRSSTLELVATQIDEMQLEGNVAELGVFQGEFAAKINQVFPKRKLYLFDTFKGFDKRDVNVEKQKNYSAGDQNFSNTSITSVLAKMTYPQNCIVREGFFPQTANGLDETFVFVSIDADLYEPIYQGLVYFYPRLANGGYIFIHDYNNDMYKGAKQAVNIFCKENKLTILPIPDLAGTAILVKPA